MAGFLGDIGDRFGTVFGSMSLGQKVTMLVVILLGLGGIYGIVQWASAPDYVPLFSNLPADDAGKITDWLTENSIPYKLEQGGGRIMVPKKEQYQARIQLAEESLPSKRSTGYEIFDQTNLGMSEFVQKLNYRRALEGELARTIESLEEIDQARVHIVLPEKALFREKEKEPTASVVLKLRKDLTPGQINGIQHLVSSAVEGLETQEVTIIDSQGNILSGTTESDPMMAMTTTQMQLKQQVEKNLGNKVETMLNQLLGPKKAIVRVAVDLDFTHSEVTSEVYDPERTAVRSEELNETQHNTEDKNQVNPNDPTQPPLGSTDTVSESNNITNYEVSKTVTSTSSQTGGIKRISASVVIDGVTETVNGPDGNPTSQYRDRTPTEMQQITNAVRGALGYDEKRGDNISVINIAFQAPKEELGPKPTVWTWLQDHGISLLRNLLLAAAIIGILFYVRNMLARSSQAARQVWERRIAALPAARSMGALPGAVGEEGEMLALPDIDSDLPPDVVEANKLQKQLVEFSSEKPEVAARLLKTWLVDENM